MDIIYESIKALCEKKDEEAIARANAEYLEKATPIYTEFDKIRIPLEKEREEHEDLIRDEVRRRLAKLQKKYGEGTQEYEKHYEQVMKWREKGMEKTHREYWEAVDPAETLWREKMEPIWKEYEKAIRAAGGDPRTAKYA